MHSPRRAEGKSRLSVNGSAYWDFPHPNGVPFISPGQRPGFSEAKRNRTLKGCHNITNLVDVSQKSTVPNRSGNSGID